MNEVEIAQVWRRLYQKRSVGVVTVVVENGLLVCDAEHITVQHQIAIDGTDTHPAKLVQGAPEPFNGQLGITPHVNVEIAVESVAHKLAIGVEAGVPMIGGPQDFQRRIGGDQLHDRAGAHQGICIDVLLDARPVHGDGREAQRLFVVQGFGGVIPHLIAPGLIGATSFG